MKLILSIVPVVVLLVTVPLPGQAQESPYAGLEKRPLKALSREEVAGYLEGAGMSLALPAELNGYPGPRHVLDNADSLGLSEDQRDSVSAIFESMQSRAAAVGREYVDAEQLLDSLFASKLITAESLQEAVQAAELLKARLRVIHLEAHLVTSEILDPDQISRYQRLRGYDGGEHADHGSHH